MNGVFNAVMVTGDQTGEVVFYGKGAGKEATASAVVADILDCIKHLKARKYLYWEDQNGDYVDNSVDELTKLYVKIKSENFEDLVSQFNNIFQDNIKVVKNEFSKEIAFITNEDYESKIKEKLAKFKNIKTIKILHTMGV